MKLRVVDLFEDIPEEDLQQFVRLFLGGSAAAVVGARFYHGCYSVALPELTGQPEMEIHLRVSMAIMVFIGLSSLVINVTLRTLIHIEKSGPHGCGGPPPMVGKPPASRYVVISLLFTAFVIAVVSVRAIPGTRDLLLFGMSCVLAPFAAIASQERMKKFAGRRTSEFFSPVANLWFRLNNAVAPEHPLAGL